MKGFYSLWHAVTGEAPLIEEDEFFSSKTDRLCEVLKQRITLYEEEEHALRVMVREEVEERMLAGEKGRRVGKGGGRSREEGRGGRVRKGEGREGRERSEHALRVMVREKVEEDAGW